MTTNNVMVRPMGDFHVEQRTKDGMFNATALLNEWNTSVKSHTCIYEDGKIKELKEFFDNKNTNEYIEALIKEENLHGGKSPYVKSRARSDRGGGTWMHPYLFVKFAMWLNPHFEVKVIKFVSDQMLKYRNESGDGHKYLSGAVATLVEKPFMSGAMSQISTAVNFCVFGEHRKMIRNERGDEASQRALSEFEHKVADLIYEGFIKSYYDLIKYLRDVWRRKFQVCKKMEV